jgi:hypothetical protein
MEAAYLFGGGVALLACFQPFQDFRHPPVGIWQRFGSKFATSLMLIIFAPSVSQQGSWFKQVYWLTESSRITYQTTYFFRREKR